VNAKSMFNHAILKFQQIRKSGEKIDQNYLVPYYYDLGYLHQRYDYYNQAKISYWKSLKQIDQSDDKEDRWYQQVAFNNFIRLAEIAIMENRLDSVSIYLDKTETIKAKFDTTLQNYYLHRFTQGKLARTDGRYKDALDYFNQNPMIQIRIPKSMISLVNIKSLNYWRQKHRSFRNSTTRINSNLP